MSKRLSNLRAKLAEEGLDALLIHQAENRRYLSGFDGSAGILLISPEVAQLATDSRYWESVERSVKDFALVKQTPEYQYDQILLDFAKTTGAKTIGFEGDVITVAQLKEMQKSARKGKFKLKAAKNLVGDLRAVKDADELAAIRRAVQLTDEAFAHFCATVRPGMTEKEGAWVIESYMRTHGADKVAFDLIVAGGPNAALPHAHASDRPLAYSEPIIVDIGCRVDGYNSDLTRTIVFGEPDAKFNEVYKTVLKAQRAAEKKIRAGVKGKRADAFARRVIQRAGYGDNFGHGLGHGVGLAVHEKPSAGKLSKDTLEAGVTLTVEPGIYISGWGGVRIEDLVVVQEEGVEVLSRASKEPVVR